MNEDLEEHVSQMLALAQSKHAIAISAVEARPIDYERVKAAVQELSDAELLVQDCLDLTGDQRLVVALAQLHEQQRLLEDGIAKLEAIAASSKPASLWPWTVLAILVIGLGGLMV